MGQPPRVQVIERRGKTLQQRHDLLRSEGRAHRDLFAQGAAPDALQYEPRRAALLAEGESADHIRMRQKLQQAGLATKTRPHLGIAPVFEAERFHDHRIARPQIATFVGHRDTGAGRRRLQIDRIAAGNGDARVRRRVIEIFPRNLLRLVLGSRVATARRRPGAFVIHGVYHPEGLRGSASDRAGSAATLAEAIRFPERNPPGAHAAARSSALAGVSPASSPM